MKCMWFVSSHRFSGGRHRDSFGVRLKNMQDQEVKDTKSVWLGCPS